jgi:hypothetical protein
MIAATIENKTKANVLPRRFTCASKNGQLTSGKNASSFGERPLDSVLVSKAASSLRISLTTLLAERTAK